MWGRLLCTSGGTEACAGRTASQAQGWRQGTGSCLPGWLRALVMERRAGDTTGCSGSFSGGARGQDGQEPLPTSRPIAARQHTLTLGC